MSSAPTAHVTSEEYLTQERNAERKSEYFGGEVFAMAGASPEHALIVTNLAGELRQQLKGRPCNVYSSDLRLRVSPTGLYTYPDVMVVCGSPIFADDQRDTLLNPTLIIEVLSESTKDYDRGRKFQHYRTLLSTGEYLTVAQDSVHIEQWTRQPDQRWILTEADNIAARISLASVGVELALSEVYDKVILPQQ